MRTIRNWKQTKENENRVLGTITSAPVSSNDHSFESWRLPKWLFAAELNGSEYVRRGKQRAGFLATLALRALL